MPQPNAGQVHVNRPLTMMSVAYMQSQTNFVASTVFPTIPVDKKSDLYFTYTKADWFRDEMRVRLAGTESAGSGYGLSTASYDCIKYALHKDVDDDTRANADSPLNLDAEATLFLTQRSLLRQEIQWASRYFTTGVWATDHTPANLWSNYTTSDPIGDVETGRTAVHDTTGFEANTLVMGRAVFTQLKNHPDIRDRLKYTTADNTTPQMLAKLFDLDRVLVCKAVENTAAEGQTAVYANVQGKHALLCYTAPAPGLLTPSAGYTFVWRGVSGALGTPVAVSQFRMEELKSDRVETEIAFDNKVVAADLGYFLDAVVS